VLCFSFLPLTGNSEKKNSSGKKAIAAAQVYYTKAFAGRLG
jgi:hypothetical protein